MERFEEQRPCSVSCWQIKTIVILERSEGSASCRMERKQVLRFAQDDNSNFMPPISERRLQPAEELAHALQAAVEFGDRGGVGNANVFLRSEAFSRHRGDVRLAQKFAGHVGRRIHPAASEEL